MTFDIVQVKVDFKIILKECDYGDEKEKQLRDQIVFGCREDSLRDKFFREAALTL